MLTPSHKALLLIESLWYLSKWDRKIRKQAFEKWQDYLNTSSKSQNSSLSLLEIQNMRKSIDAIVRRYPRELNCMRRCLALKSMIERRGGQCRLHIGVKIEKLNTESNDQTQTLHAHAWLSLNGKVINDSPESIEQYQEITHDNALFSRAASSGMQ